MTKTSLISFAVAAIIALYEFAGVLRARMAGKTKSTGRVVLRGAVLFIVGALFWQQWDWRLRVAGLVVASGPLAKLGTSSYIACLISTGLLVVLVSAELVSLYRAKIQGRTPNTSRLVTYIFMLLCMIPIIRDTIALKYGLPG